jgi:hypothetical protein
MMISSFPSPCMRANMAQNLSQDSNINFCDRNSWCERLPDLNVAEHIGTVIKNEIENKMLSEMERNLYEQGPLKKHITELLTKIELFETLLCLYPSRLCTVKNATGCHTDY